MIPNCRNIAFFQQNFRTLQEKLRSKNSASESKVYELLVKSGFFFVREKCNYKIGTRWCYYDFYIPFLRIYLEIDGPSHENISQKLTDADKDQIIWSKQRFIVRITNDEVKSLSEINQDFLIKKAAQTVIDNYNVFPFCNHKRIYDIDEAVNYVWHNIVSNINQSIGDAHLTHKGVRFQSRNVFVYSKHTNLYYHFVDLRQALAVTGLSVSYILSLIGKTYSNKNNSIKFICASNKSRFADKVYTVFELTLKDIHCMEYSQTNDCREIFRLATLR